MKNVRKSGSSFCLRCRRGGVFFALFGSGGKDDARRRHLIANGNFALTTDGEPDGWQTGAWVTSAGASYLEAVTLEDGTTAALVENAAANDARFEQTIAVRENAIQADRAGEGGGLRRGDEGRECVLLRHLRHEPRPARQTASGRR
ncbi:MAG: hypothetical protein ACLUI3_15390 [Christensenellales bacterium]